MPLISVLSYSPSSPMSVLSSGLASPNGALSPAASLTQGIAVGLPKYTTLNPLEAVPNPSAQLAAIQTSQVTTSTMALATQTILRDANGIPVMPILMTPPQINVGSGSVMSFDPRTLAAKITPALAIPSNKIQDLVGQTNQFFTGSDIRLMIELDTPLSDKRYAKQLMECTTLSVAVFRAKDAVRAGGFIGAKGYSRGGRTVAGTLVLTQFSQDVLFEFLSAYGLSEKSKSNSFAKIDQLPPFNITAIFTNEYGYASYRRLTGVEFVQDGTVYSINDAFSEQTISYVASDFTTLMPLSFDSLMKPPASKSPAAAREKTPADCMTAPASKNALVDNGFDDYTITK